MGVQGIGRAKFGQFSSRKSFNGRGLSTYSHGLKSRTRCLQPLSKCRLHKLCSLGFTLLLRSKHCISIFAISQSGSSDTRIRYWNRFELNTSRHVRVGYPWLADARAKKKKNRRLYRLRTSDSKRLLERLNACYIKSRVPLIEAAVDEHSKFQNSKRLRSEKRELRQQHLLHLGSCYYLLQTSFGGPRRPPEASITPPTPISKTPQLMDKHELPYTSQKPTLSAAPHQNVIAT